MADRPVRFNRRTADHIVDSTMRVEADPYPTAARQRAAGVAWLPVVECVVTTAITEANGTTYGVGAIQPYSPSYNTNASAWHAAPDYTYASINANTNSVTNTCVCINWSQNSNTIAVNTHGWAVWRNGVFEWLVGDC